eukprot:TRINITY_DN6913_c0_g2_i1.p1 TRINITY_DN6913_c0_g2~~TRINITY_DN6913_c0_g2_i1.p1  ORF type:complete len:186 (+),score=20.11 TRINITY_DN6913_c0_g2_i1:84-560(+)
MARQLLWVLSCVLLSALRTSCQEIYERTWSHHGAAFMSLNVSKTVEDYAEDAHINTLNHLTGERLVYKGKDGASNFFTLFYSRIRGDDNKNALRFADGFDVHPPMVDGNTMFLAWKCNTSVYMYHWAADTFVMGLDGKFTHHNIYYSGQPSSQSVHMV